MNLVEASHPALWTPADPVVDIAPFAALVAKLDELRKSKNAVGLAATQVGASVALFVTKYEAFPTVFNPRYTAAGTERLSKPEATLSRTGFSTYVARPFRINAEWHDGRGDLCQAPLNDMEARVFMHLADLCAGKPIFPRPVSRQLPLGT